MNILRAKWESAEAYAKELCDQGVSTSACIYALNEAWRFYYLMREAEEKEKRAKSEEISWGKWRELINRAKHACIYEGNFEAVRDILDAANVMKNKVRAKEEAPKEAAKEAIKRAAEKAEKRKAWLEDISWDKFNELMDKADEIWEYGGDSEEVSNLLKAAHVMGDKLKAADKKMKEEKAATIAKEEATKTTFEETGKTIGQLVDVKNVKYGDSFSKSGSVLKILYPDGIKPEQYDDVLTVARILDKLFRVATDKDALGESPYTDIAGYCILAVNESEKEKL